ncbi:MAG: PKD domain-containing protein [Kiritimatiellae bacterium]|nr:PKD domain-containing protein [Kiritimatiellia bacterium]
MHVALGDIHYVDVACTNATAPYTNWATAATVIQDAVDAAEDGDTVLVNDGIYDTGGRDVTNGFVSRVAITNTIAVESVDGPDVTLIVGQGPIGSNAIRCAYLINGAVLAGFTLTNGHTRADGDAYLEQSGGGVWCEGLGAVLSNCTVIGNTADHNAGGAGRGTLYACRLIANAAQQSGGGGAYDSVLYGCLLCENNASSGGGANYGVLHHCRVVDNMASGKGGGASLARLHNCLIAENSADQGGGASVCTLNNCTVVDNLATSGGGIHGGALTNSIVYFNTARTEHNYADSVSFDHCCTLPQPAGGAGNTTNDPQLASMSHLSLESPCRAAGRADGATGTDIDGEDWSDPPAIGCDELHVGSATGTLSVLLQTEYTNIATGFATSFRSQIEGRTTASRWAFGDGVILSNRPAVAHAWTVGGEYAVTLTAYNDTFPAGISAAATVHVVEEPVYYVACGSSNPVAPYTNWATAATEIQDAVDVALPGALVVVANGVYDTGGRSGYPAGAALTNRVAIHTPLTVCSVNGPEHTLVVGQGPVGDGAARCVFMTNGAVLAGFTVTNGATLVAPGAADGNGGGVFCAGLDAVLSNCVLVGNSASGNGGGTYDGTLYDCALRDNATGYGGGGACAGTLCNCVLTHNTAKYGGGAGSAILNNCTLTKNWAQAGGGADGSVLNGCAVNGNSAVVFDGGGSRLGTVDNCTLVANTAARDGGGAYEGLLRNSIVYFNSASCGANYYSEDPASLQYCCITPLPIGGISNTAADPGLASMSHLGIDSPCRGSANAAYAIGTDIDGESWAAPPSIGCDEFHAGAATGALTVAAWADYTNVVVGFPVNLTAEIEGRTTHSRWTFGDGAAASNRPCVSHSWGSAGTRVVTLTACNDTYPAGLSATLSVHVVEQTLYHVARDSAAPVAPYADWETAAAGIQDAIDLAVPGALVLVSNGVYDVGGMSGYPAGSPLTNRVVIHKPITVRSVNGPSVTAIAGQGPVGEQAVRCVYVVDGAVLAGFTLTNGATWAHARPYDYGGGVWCAGTGAVVSNCVVAGNSADGLGGGAYCGTLVDCRFIGNSALGGGGACGAVAQFCKFEDNHASGGGGVSDSVLRHCMLVGNVSLHAGGGATGGTLQNCLLIGNSGQSAGAANGSTLQGCTLTGNTATDYGGGTWLGTLNSCVLYFNTAPEAPNHQGGTLNYCVTTPLPTNGVGNIDADPMFVDTNAANYRLQAASPCIDAGINAAWMHDAVDLAGNPRIVNGTVDIGAYETPFAVDLRVWLQGAYDPAWHAMSTALSGAALPSNAPYAADNRAVSSTLTQAADWVLVELRAETNGPVVCARSALLRNDGLIVSESGATGLTVSVDSGSSCYIAVKHRNHAAVLSAQPVTFTNILVTYDFTTGPDKYYGGTNACVELEPGVWGMIAGDADGDGKITWVDRAIASNQVGRSGYWCGDADLNGDVDE